MTQSTPKITNLFEKETIRIMVQSEFGMLNVINKLLSSYGKKEREIAGYNSLSVVFPNLFQFTGRKVSIINFEGI